MTESPAWHPFLKRLLDGELRFVELAGFASQYHHVVAERHAAEGVALHRVPLLANGGDVSIGSGSLAKLWLQFTFAVGGVPAHPHGTTRACVCALRALSHASSEAAVGVVSAIDGMEAAMAERFCGQQLRDAYELDLPLAVEYFEQWSDRRERWLEAAETAAGHPDALAAHVAADAALGRFLDGLAARRPTSPLA